MSEELHKLVKEAHDLLDSISSDIDEETLGKLNEIRNKIQSKSKGEDIVIELEKKVFKILDHFKINYSPPETTCVIC